MLSMSNVLSEDQWFKPDPSHHVSFEKILNIFTLNSAKNPKFNFENILEINGTIQKYCQRDFI